MAHRDRATHYWHASILPDIAPEIACYIMVAIVACTLNEIGHPIVAPTPFFTAVSIVVAFLLVFRTNTAYDRFWDGRRQWSTMTTAVRNFARVIMCELTCDGRPAALQTLLQLLCAIKDYLRYESQSGRRQKENALGRFLTVPKSRANTMIDISTMGADVLQPNLVAELPTHAALPLQLMAVLQMFVDDQRRHSLLDTAQLNFLTTQISSVNDAYCQCQRILRTPVPAAYEIHLQHIISVQSSGWYTVPMSALVYFVILGVKAIGKEIENPFGTDYNDLPLERFCENIAQEFQLYDQHRIQVSDRKSYIVAEPSPEPPEPDHFGNQQK